MPHRTSARRALVVLALASVSMTAVSCTSDPPSPAEQRVERMRDRLEVSFSDRQVDCILEALDADTLEALDQEEALASDSPALRTFSDALAFCVAS